MKEMWSNWGEHDEAGALNRIGHVQVAAAAELVTQGRVISLAQPIGPDMVIPAHRPGIMHFMGRDGGDYAAGRRRPGGFQFAEDTLVLPLHAGTHMDALCHCWYDDTLYNGFSADEVTSSGARRLGIDKAPPVAARGVLVDLVTLTGSPLADGTAIDADMLQAGLSSSGLDMRDGDVVLIRTGWMERQEGVRTVDFNAEPGIDISAGMALAEAGVAMVGADNFAIEVLPFAEGTVFPVHQRLIRDFGIPFLENLVLEPLAREGVGTFFFLSAPLPIRGATASPVNPVAVL